MNGANIITMLHSVKQPHTFSDGIHVPKGFWVAAPASALHRSERLYENPDVFGGFRFYNMWQIEGNAIRFQSASTTLDYLPFGRELHAFPERFFAVNQIKIMLLHIVCNYECKFGSGKSRPANGYEGLTFPPNLTTRFFIRNREDRKDSILYPRQ